MAPTPAITGNPEVLSNDIQTYSTPVTPNNFKWSVEGGKIIGPDDLDTIQVQWDPVSTLSFGSVSVVEREVTLDGGTGADMLPVSILAPPQPVITGPLSVVFDSYAVYSTYDTGNDFMWSVTGGTIIG